MIWYLQGWRAILASTNSTSSKSSLLDTHVHERQPDAAVVQATVRYTMHSGRVTEETHRFRLVAYPETQRWLIAEQTPGARLPRGP